MVTVHQAFNLALQHHQAGRLAEAEALYRQILAAQPNHDDALHYLGLIAHQVGRNDTAVEWISQAIALNPNQAAAHANLGEVYRAMGHLEQAVSSYHRAIQLTPNYAVAWCNLGNGLSALGRREEAVAAFRRALELKPDYVQAFINLTAELVESGRLDEAAAACREFLQRDSNSPQAHNNLGVVLAEQGHWEQAAASYRMALQFQPRYPEAHNNLGNALKAQGQLDEAISCYRRALEWKPAFLEAHLNLATALTESARAGEAILVCRRALQLNPDCAETFNNLGLALGEQGQFDEAITAYRRALALKPRYADAWNNLGYSMKEESRVGEAAAAFRQAVQSNPEHALAHSNLIFALLLDPSDSSRPIAEAQRRWNQQFSDPVRRFIRPYATDLNSSRRLRLGYVSPDFRSHVVGRNIMPLFENHDDGSFEVFCYSGVMSSDGMTEAFRRRTAQWRSTVGVRDEALTEMIRQDGIEYRISDRWMEAGASKIESLPGRERSPSVPSHLAANVEDGERPAVVPYPDRKEHVFLIDSFWCYDPCGMEVTINDLPATETGLLTFGSLNNFCKVNEPVLRLWARVLKEVPKARLVMLSGMGSHRQRTLDFLQQEGVGAQRVEFVEPRPRKEYLELYHRLDIALDTFPYNGHPTSLDALWMGVPVVSLAGERAVSRAGLSQLSNLGLPELVAHSEDEYVEIATRLARDLPRLAELRRTLRQRMEASVLMDGPRFARHIEAAYRAMWRRWCAETQS